MHSTPALAFTILIGALAGCHAPEEETPGADHRLMGAFSDHNETIQQDFDATVSPYSQDVLIMESFPPQFQILDLDPQACPELRSLLIAKEYIASVGACEPEPTGTNGDDTVSSD